MLCTSSDLNHLPYRRIMERCHNSARFDTIVDPPSRALYPFDPTQIFCSKGRLLNECELKASLLAMQNQARCTSGCVQMTPSPLSDQHWQDGLRQRRLRPMCVSIRACLPSALSPAVSRIRSIHESNPMARYLSHLALESSFFCFRDSFMLPVLSLWP